MSRQIQTANSMLDSALHYYDEFGWCVIRIPYGQKKAQIKWGRYQKARPDRAQVQAWFASGETNIAVVLGAVSGDLCCRDFDTADGYSEWAKEYPNLARLLPTVKTPRGCHVYFQSAISGIHHLGDGELRGSRGYCVLPPSLHPDGVPYEWVNPPTKQNLLVVEAEKAGFLEESARFTETAERSEENRRDESKEESAPFCDVELIEVNDKIRAAIGRTLPQEHGTRHRRIFDFARELKSMPEYTAADPRVFRRVVEEWHRRALPYIVTEPFEETWIDFLRAWPKVKFGLGEGPMAEIFQRAIRLAPPAVAVEKYPSHGQLQLLASLCRELQRAAGDGPFFLGCRTAGRLLAVTPMTVSRWLFLLEAEGILKTITKGGTKENPRKASRFRYLAGIED